jgi:hypothetical protein
MVMHQLSLMSNEKSMNDMKKLRTILRRFLAGVLIRP